MSYVAGGQVADMVPVRCYRSTLVLKSGNTSDTLWSTRQCVDQIRQGGWFLSMLIHERAIPDALSLTNLCDPEIQNPSSH